MSFMRAEITDNEQWLLVETECDTTLLPLRDYGLSEEDVRRMSAELEDGVSANDPKDAATGEFALPAALRDFVYGRYLRALELFSGYGVRASAPGYLDCTEWNLFETAEEADEAYKELDAELRGEDVEDASDDSDDV